MVVVWMSKAFTHNFDKSECGDSGGGGGDECFDGGGERCGGADGGWKQCDDGGNDGGEVSKE